MPALAELEQSAAQAWADPAFTGKLNHLLKTYVGRATPLYEAERLTTHYRRDDGGPRIWLKREDLNHTGAHSTDLTKLQAVPHPASQHTPSNVVHLCVRILHDEIFERIFTHFHSETSPNFAPYPRDAFTRMALILKTLLK